MLSSRNAELVCKQEHRTAWALTENDPVFRAWKPALVAAFQGSAGLSTPWRGVCTYLGASIRRSKFCAYSDPSKGRDISWGLKFCELLQSPAPFFLMQGIEAVTPSAEASRAVWLQLRFQLGDWDSTVQTGRRGHCKPAAWCSHLGNYLDSMCWILHYMLRPLHPPLSCSPSNVSITLFSGQLLKAVLLPPCSLVFIQPAVDCQFCSGVIVYVLTTHNAYMLE